MINISRNVICQSMELICFYSALVTPPGILCLVWVTAFQGRCRQTRENPQDSNKNHQKSRKYDLCGKNWRNLDYLVWRQENKGLKRSRGREKQSDCSIAVQG